MKRLLTITFLLFCCAVQSQQLRFKYTYGGLNHDYGRSVKQTFDVGYIAAGSTNSFGNGNMDMLLIKTDSMGAQKWAHTFGGTGVEWGYSVQQTKDTGYVLAGYTNSFGAGGYDFYLVKTDSLGNVKWTKTYGGSDWDFAYSVEQTSDGGYIMAGGTYSDTKGDEDMYLVKTDANGDTLWTRKYGGVKQDEARSVKQTSDLGYIITGFTKTASDTLGNVFLIKTDQNGDTLWTRVFGGSGTDFGNEVIENTSLASYIVVGGTNSSLPDLDFYLLRVDYSGNTVWEKVYKPSSGNADDVANAVTNAPNNTFAFVGYNFSNSAGFNDIFFMKFDKDGYYITATTHGTFQHEDGFSIQNTKDKGFIICGFTDSTGTGFGLPNLFLVKTDSMGYTLKAFAVGVNDQLPLESNSSNVYPNPFNRSAKLVLTTPRSFNSRTSTLSISLFDVTGRNVTSQAELSEITFNAGAIELSIARKDLAPGIYFMNIISDHEVLGQGKLIITD